MHSEAHHDDQPSTGNPSDTPGRAYRAKGPTLGKGKACESCRNRRTRCNGVRPTCSNCDQSERDCVYLDKPRPPSSAVALLAKLAGLEERYRMLSEMEAARTGQEGGRIVVNESARNWVASLDYPRLPPLRPESVPPQPGALDDPYLEATMTKKERKLMIELYQGHCYRYGVTIAPSNLVSRLEASNVAERPHACVLNAMMLAARDIATSFAPEPVLDETGARYVDFVMPESTPSEDVLLTRIQAQCTQSLADVDRLTDYIQASLLLAHWYVRKGRILEGQYSAAAVNRLVINCRLHQIDDGVMRELAPRATPPPEGQSRWDDTLLGRPKDREDLAVRISLFWESFFIDKVLRIITGVPPTYDDDNVCHITTAFPRTRDEYISGAAFDVPYASVDNLFDGTGFPAQHVDTIGMSLRFTPAAEVLQVYQSIANLKALAKRTFSSSPYTRPAPIKSRAFCVASFKSMVQLLALVAEIHITYVKNPDGTPIIFDKEGAFAERVNAAHGCSVVLGAALDEIKGLGAGLPSEGRRPGIEHTCFMVGLLLMFPIGILMEKIVKLEAKMESAIQGSPMWQELEQQKNEEVLHFELMLETINVLQETYPVVGFSIKDLQWQALQEGRPISVV
ncbi:hypothetical protein FRC01_001692 [Tulasnella sp. 417]|nr:hypothetical protein FRC01_001692 [Tulasnella sp. 417]